RHCRPNLCRSRPSKKGSGRSAYSASARIAVPQFCSLARLLATAMDAGQGPDSDDYFKATGRNASCDVETRVQKLNFLSTSRSPSAQKDQQDGREPQAAKAKKDKKSKPEQDEEAHVLGAWLQDEHVLELLKIHAGGKKKKDNTGSIYTTSQSE
ncbi:unnamed protein product, partial [Symbiodinium necroappetens]